MDMGIKATPIILGGNFNPCSLGCNARSVDLTTASRGIVTFQSLFSWMCAATKDETSVSDIDGAVKHLSSPQQ